MPRARNPNSNRTDLNGPGREPISSAPGQQYGRQTAQQQAQRILPIAAPPTPAPGATDVGSPAPATDATPPPTGPPPGGLPWLEPTGHGLPVTTGLPTGAGQGRSALVGPAAQWHAQQSSEQGSLQQMLGSLAARPGASSAVKNLAARAGAQVD